MKFQSIETSKEYYKNGVIGTLRNEISILEDGIVDYCDCIDKIEEENKELKLAVIDQEDDIKSLNIKLDNGENCDHEWYNDLKDVINSRDDEIKSLHELITAKHVKRNEDSNLIASLKAEIKGLKSDNHIFKIQNDSLKNKLHSVNVDYNNDCKVHNDYADGLLEEINELKALANHNIDVKKRVINDRMPKEYIKEADEFFEHNEKQSRVWFYMLDEYAMRDALLGDLMLNEDDALCVIDNDNV